MVVKAGGEVPELPRRQQTSTTTSGNHTDVSSLRHRLAAPAQPVSSIISVEAKQEVSESRNSTIQPDRGVRFQADDDIVEKLELALGRSEEEEFNVDEGAAATDQSLTQQEPTNALPPGDNLDASHPSFEAAGTIETLSAGGDIP